MNEELKQLALSSLMSFEIIQLSDLPNVIETIQKCYNVNNPNETFLWNELQYFIDGLKNNRQRM